MAEQTQDYGLFDYLQLMAWYVILGLFIWQWGWIFGIIANVVFVNVVGLLLKATMNLELLNGCDEFFFLDDERNRLNIVAFQKYEKFNYEQMAQAMVSRACVFPRLKSRVRKFLGKFMFEELTDKEMMDSIQKICPAVSGIHNEQQLADFMAKEQSTRLPLGYLQWRLFFIPDYSETESVFVYKVHHSLADGIANILMFFQLTDKPQFSDYPMISPRFSTLQDIGIKLVMPFYLPRLLFKILI